MRQMNGRNRVVLEIPENRRPTTPGEMLIEEFLKPLGVTQTEFARHIGVTYARLNEVVHGRRRLTVDTAMRFAKALRTSPDSWLNLQHMVDLYDARHSKRAKAIERIRPIAALRSAS
jgi:addiction module HigA family antidote